MRILSVHRPVGRGCILLPMPFRLVAARRRQRDALPFCTFVPAVSAAQNHLRTSESSFPTGDAVFAPVAHPLAHLPGALAHPVAHQGRPSDHLLLREGPICCGCPCPVGFGGASSLITYRRKDVSVGLLDHRCHDWLVPRPSSVTYAVAASICPESRLEGHCGALHRGTLARRTRPPQRDGRNLHVPAGSANRPERAVPPFTSYRWNGNGARQSALGNRQVPADRDGCGRNALPLLSIFAANGCLSRPRKP